MGRFCVGESFYPFKSGTSSKAISGVAVDLGVNFQDLMLIPRCFIGLIGTSLGFGKRYLWRGARELYKSVRRSGVQGCDGQKEYRSVDLDLNHRSW
jgi:hypothetical protein